LGLILFGCQIGCPHVVVGFATGSDDDELELEVVEVVDLVGSLAAIRLTDGETGVSLSGGGWHRGRSRGSAAESADVEGEHAYTFNVRGRGNGWGQRGACRCTMFLVSIV
jgi:hypothetical protein